MTSELYQNALKIEEKILIQSEEEQQEKEWIHSYQVKDKNQQKPNIVLIHGYLSCGATYYKLLKQLSNNYNIYGIDLPGMGLSSRPDFNLTDKNEIINYFTERIDKFAEKQKLQKFTLVGHSFGGYISAHYAFKYPQKVEKLFLVSPLGVTSRSEEEIESIKQQQNNSGFLVRQLYKYVRYYHGNGGTLASLSQKPFMPTSYFLKRWMKYWFPNSEIEYQLWYEYMNNILQLPLSTDSSLVHLFRMERLSAHLPLEYSIPQNIKAPVYFIYGDRDWMCKIGAQRLVDSNILNVKHSFNIVENSGHNIIYDNPQKLEELINNL